MAKAYLADVGSTSGQLPRYIAWHDSWLKQCRLCCSSTVPRPPSSNIRRLGARSVSGAPPEKLRGSPWPQELASGHFKVEDCPLPTTRRDAASTLAYIVGPTLGAQRSSRRKPT